MRRKEEGKNVPESLSHEIKSKVKGKREGKEERREEERVPEETKQGEKLLEGKPREICDCDHSIKHKTCSETSSSEEEEEEEEEEEDRGRRFAERGVCASGIRGERERRGAFGLRAVGDVM